MCALPRRHLIKVLLVAMLSAGCGTGESTPASPDDATIASDDAAPEVDGDGGVLANASADGGRDATAAALDATLGADGTVSADARVTMDGSPGGCGVLGTGPLFVDPTRGSDSAAGTNGAPECRMRTVTAALSRIRSGGAPAPRTIVVLGDVSYVTGERTWFVPADVQVIGAEASVGSSAFTPMQRRFSPALPPSFGAPTAVAFGGARARLGYFIVDGQAGAGTVPPLSGIEILAAGDGMVLDHVVAQHFSNSAITIGIGGFPADYPANALTRVTLTAVEASDNGSDGLSVAASGRATILGGSGAPSIFSRNGHAGINIRGGGATIDGAANGGFDVRALDNARSGILATSPTRPGPTIDVRGFQARGHLTYGAGIELDGEVTLKLRRSEIVGNKIGVLAVSFNGAVGELSGLDLGTATDPGSNVLQATGALANQGPGLCIRSQNQAASTLTIVARGNRWLTTIGTMADCASSTATLARRADCTVTGTPYALGIEPKAAGALVEVAGCQ